MREQHRQQLADRKRNVIVLIQAFLRAEGYVSSLQQLESETNVSLQRFEPCDNIDLLSIVAEYEEYYKFKFDK